MRNLFALVSGGLFGAGLLIAGVTDTTVILGWLDLTSRWDPTLGFFFVASATPMAFAWWLARGRSTALLGSPMPVKVAPKISKNLVVGSLMFGTGWGLAGICPGPSMASISYGGVSGMVFLASMIAGMLIAVPVKRWQGARATGIPAAAAAAYEPGAGRPNQRVMAVSVTAMTPSFVQARWRPTGPAKQSLDTTSALARPMPADHAFGAYIAKSSAPVRLFVLFEKL